ncbi:MAG TPA: TonB family protein [Pyrinomonadaceae bacterium]|nr:TonB family protein [Pyrinomonadaceae bacterium]
MFATWFLQRVLPFTLTLLVGSLAGGASGLFGWSGASERAETGVLVFKERGRRGCRDRAARRWTRAKKSTPVVYTYEPNTRYTEEAMRRGVTGVVRLRVTFGAGGRIERVEPVLGLPYGLTEQAERVAWATRFTPASEHGVPITVTKEVDYVFSLSDRMKAGL